MLLHLSLSAAVPRIQPILDLAQSTPPEFHAWTLLKILQSGNQVKDRAIQRRLIEQAYELASAAQARYPVQPLNGIPQNSLSYLRGQAGALGLESLSLQTRAVEFMLPLDKARARQMFADIPRPSIPAMGCGDDLLPRLGEYYRTLGRVAQETFTPKERQREDHISFLAEYIGAIGSPSQLVPAAAMLQNLSVSPEQKQLLYAKLGSALESVTPDDRSFAEITSALTPLLTADLMPAFQRFIANHAAAPRCKHDTQQLTVGSASAETYKGELLGDNEQAKRIRQMAWDLRIRNSRVLTEADRAEAAWQLAYNNFLDALAQRQQAETESEAAFFHETVSGWMTAADLAPTPQARARAFAEAARIIASSPLETSSPAEWLYQIVQGIPGRAPSDDLLRAYQDSGNPALAVYAALVRLAGPNVVQ
ncbi:MAG TPA: hypothetical protein VFA04_26680 [Bryobacteraceae bacterium]|nr:hypothetical protein [Bryobacteraceae bacterium]